MNLFQKSITELHPENTTELIEWARKWNITLNELIRAIVETGSTNIHLLRAYIRKNKSRRNIEGGWKLFFGRMHESRSSVSQ